MAFFSDWGLISAIAALGLYSLYWRVAASAQNWLLLGASLAFSAAYDVRFAFVLLLSTLLDFWIGLHLDWERPDIARTRWLWASIVLNIGLLTVFRVHRLWGGSSGSGPSESLASEFAVSLGLSFYVLQRSTHALDVYFRVLRPCRNLLQFSTFVSFFPLLASGPIERAVNILPQLERPRRFDWQRFFASWWLIALGAFEKVFIADHCGELASALLKGDSGRLATVLGIYAYAFQLFADFAGYSDMARGAAGLFGIDVMQNFEAPYLSPNLSVFWQRWHISLSSWLNDYVFRPSSTALRNWGALGTVCAAFLTFIVSGLWHGSGTTFLVWGALHAAGISLFLVTKRARKRFKQRFPGAVSQWLGVFLTFHFVCLCLVVFRAANLSEAWHTFRQLGVHGQWHEEFRPYLAFVAVAGVAVIILQALQLKHRSSAWIFQYPVWVRALCYTALLFCILMYPGPTGRFLYAEF